MAKKKDNGNALAVRKERFEALFNLESFKEKLQEVMPKHLTKERLVQIVLVAMSRQPKLFDCEEGSVLRSVMVAGELGLDCVGTLGEGYLVPFWSGKNKCLECQFIPGYQGLIKLARQSGVVQKIEARLVYDGDVFKANYGTRAEIIHEPKFKTKDILLVYAVALFKPLAGAETTTQFEIMPLADVEDIMNRSNSKNQSGKIVGPWKSDFPEMAKKTAVRRLAKYLPKSKELAIAFEADNKQYDESFAATAEVIGKGLAGLKETIANANAGTKQVDSKVTDTPQKQEGKVEPERQKKADDMAADLQADEASQELPKYQCNDCKKGFDSLNKDGKCPLCFSDKFYEM